MKGVVFYPPGVLEASRLTEAALNTCSQTLSPAVSVSDRTRHSLLLSASGYCVGLVGSDFRLQKLHVKREGHSSTVHASALRAADQNIKLRYTVAVFLNKYFRNYSLVQLKTLRK